MFMKKYCARGTEKRKAEFPPLVAVCNPREGKRKRVPGRRAPKCPLSVPWKGVPTLSLRFA